MRKKKTLDDLRFELNIYLRNSDIEDPMDWIHNYEKLVKLSEPIKYKHIGPFRVPMDIYSACQVVVPKKTLQRYEQRLMHLLNTTDQFKIMQMRNNISQQFLDLYEEWSNVNTEEAKRNYN